MTDRRRREENKQKKKITHAVGSAIWSGNTLTFLNVLTVYTVKGFEEDKNHTKHF